MPPFDQTQQMSFQPPLAQPQPLPVAQNEQPQQQVPQQSQADMARAAITKLIDAANKKRDQQIYGGLQQARFGMQKASNEYVKANQQISQALVERTKIESEMNNERLKLARQQQAATMEHNARVKSAFAEMESDKAAIMDEYNILSRNAREAGAVDPNRILKKGYNKLVASIAIGIGEFTRIMTGGSRNTAYDIVQDAIERDVQDQLSERQDRSQAMDERSRTLNLIGQRYGARINQEQFLKSQSQEAMAEQLQVLEAQYANPKAKALLQDARAKLLQDSAKHKESLMQAKFNQAATESGLRLQEEGIQAAGERARQAAEREQAKEQRRKAEIAYNVPEGLEFRDDPERVVPSDPERARVWEKDVKTLFRGIVPHLNVIEDVYKEIQKNPSSTQYSALGAKASGAMFLIAQAYGAGALAGPDQQLLENQISQQPVSYWIMNGGERLKATMQLLGNYADSGAKTYGLGLTEDMKTRFFMQAPESERRGLRREE